MGELIVDESRASDGVRAALVVVGGEQHQMYVQRVEGPLATGCADAFLLATVAMFMCDGEPMHVSGAVSRRLLIGLEEWQRAWSRWKPDVYTPVAITADEVLIGYPTTARAVSTFTGGVDSTYTIHRHLTGAAGNATADLTGALFVHGFDIPLADPTGFEASCKRASGFLEQAGLDLITVRTNLRDLGSDWPDVHGLSIASILTALAPDYGVGLIASSAPYRTLASPLGSNAITDSLMSSGMMDIRYDGAEMSRVEKVKALLADPVAISQLRFCWETEPHDENCGVCEKCIRTACEFLANGAGGADCFTRWPTIDQIRSVPIATTGRQEAVGWVLDAAAAAGTDGQDWWTALSEALAASR